MQRKYLDQTGLAEVAGYVNSRLKTVTTMPITANDKAVRLYVGEDIANYLKGHTYEANTIGYFAWRYESAPGVFSTYYTLSTTPEVDDDVYSYLNDEFEVAGQVEVVGTDEITFASHTFSRYTDGDITATTWTDITAGGGSAEEVSYENEQIPSATNVEDALNTIIGKIYYVDPAITSFTMTPSTDTYEIGSTVNELTFAWAYNKDIVSQTLTDCTLADETVRSATYSTPLNSNKTFTLTASDGKNSVSASKSVSFKHKVYWGAASEPASFDSAFILALTGKKFATNYKGSYSMNLGEGQYGYIAYPASWGKIDSWYIGGFEITTHDCGTIEFTNASGNTTTFRITRTTQPGLGSISVEVK